MTIARGVPAPKRAVAAITTFGHWMIDREAITDVMRSEARSPIAGDAAERRAIQRDHAWVEAAAAASMRIPRG